MNYVARNAKNLITLRSRGENRHKSPRYDSALNIILGAFEFKEVERIYVG